MSDRLRQLSLAGAAVLFACLFAGMGIAGSVQPSYERLYKPTSTAAPTPTRAPRRSPAPVPSPTLQPGQRLYRTLGEAQPNVPFPLGRPRAWREGVLASVLVTQAPSGEVLLVQQRYTAFAPEGIDLRVSISIVQAPLSSPSAPNRAVGSDPAPLDVRLPDRRVVPGVVSRRGAERWLTWSADGMAYAVAAPDAFGPESLRAIAQDLAP